MGTPLKEPRNRQNTRFATASLYTEAGSFSRDARILLAVGGSGGHLLPAQQLAVSLAGRADLLFAGHGLDSSPFFQRERFAFQAIAAAPLLWSRRGLSRFIARSIGSFFAARRLICAFQPEVVVGFGSYHAFPVLMAALLMRKKIVLFEANCLLGKVNRFFSPFALWIAAQFPLPAVRKEVRLVPLLPWKEKGPVPGREESIEAFGLDPGRRTFLVFGGSQGAQFFNRAIPKQIPSNAQVIHLTGHQEAVQDTTNSYAALGVPACVKAFEPAMEKAYAAADFAICRAGASTLAELIHYALPALLIPFPCSADGHQQLNAQFLAKKMGAAKIIFESEAEGSRLCSAIEELVEGRDSIYRALTVLRSRCEGRKEFSEQILGA